MRVIVTSRNSLPEPQVLVVSQRLAEILVQVRTNPANPRFNHYLFESLGAWIKFVGPRSQTALADLADLLMPQLMVVLQAEATTFTPYVSQLLVQLIKSNNDQTLDSTYQASLRTILLPALWDCVERVPALVRPLQAFIKHGSELFSAAANFEPILSILRGLFIPLDNDKDQHGFDLLQTI